MFHSKVKFLIAFYRLSDLCRKAFNLVSKWLFNKTSCDVNATATNNKVVLDAADKIGVSIRKMPHQIFQLKYGNYTCYSHNSDFSFENLMAYKMCGNKLLTSTILSENNVPVPVFNAFSLDEYDDALEFFLSRKKPVVVKPCRGTSHAKGITVGVSSASTFSLSFAKALCFSDTAMVEEFARGENYRLTVLNGRVLTVVKRICAYVVGDGINTINSLVTLKNNTLFDPMMETRLLEPIAIDSHVVANLKDQRLTLKSIPKKGEKVILRKTPGGDGEIAEITEQCHSDYKEIAVRAAELMNTKLSGIDLIAENISSPFEPGNAVINEVNTTPALYIVRELGTHGEINTRVGEEILSYAFGIAPK